MAWMWQQKRRKKAILIFACTQLSLYLHQLSNTMLLSRYFVVDIVIMYFLHIARCYIVSYYGWLYCIKSQINMESCQANLHLPGHKTLPWSKHGRKWYLQGPETVCRLLERERVNEGTAEDVLVPDGQLCVKTSQNCSVALELNLWRNCTNAILLKFTEWNAK